MSQEKRKIAAIRVENRFRKDIGNIDTLIDSIRENGLLHPVVITEEGLLVAGQRRIAACKALGWEDIPVTVLNIKDITRGQADENSVRKNLTPSEAVAAAKMLELELKKASTEKHNALGETEPEPAKGKLPPSGGGKSRDKLARSVGMSGRTLEKAIQVVNAAQQDPDKYNHLVEKMDRKGKVDGVFRELKRLQIRNSSAETAATTTTEELFSVIFAVPRWTKAHQGDGVVGHKEQVDVLSLREMKKLKPPIAPAAVLFLQTPASSLVSALELLAAWGFKYLTFLVLERFNPSGSTWLKEYHRAVLVGVRGEHRAPLPENLLNPVILQTTPNPETTVCKYIERMFPGEKYLGIFSRSTDPGWVSWSRPSEAAEKLEETTSGNPATGLK
jgi:ParB family chromosome partitioning protein